MELSLNHTVAGERPGPRRKAFTLIELLVAIGIIAILVALVVGVSQYLYAQSGKQTTASAMKITTNAIMLFHETYGKYPLEDADPDKTGEVLFNYLTGSSNFKDADYTYVMGPAPTGTQLDDLRKDIRTKIAIKLQNLPKKCLGASDTAIKDAYGKVMRYSANGGLGQAPVLVSAGPDGDFGTNDDIRSDNN